MDATQFRNACGRTVYDRRVVDFVASKIGPVPSMCTAVGWESRGSITAGALFERFNGRNVYFHGAADGSKHFHRAYLRAIAHHAFVTLGAERVTTITQASNASALAWDKGYGFVEEGRMARAAHDGSDAVILVLWKEGCRWLS